MKASILSIFACLLTTSAFAETQMWVASERASRRTSPSIDCEVVGQLFFRELATVIETRDGWARVTKYYDAACIGGRSEYVDQAELTAYPKMGSSM